MVSQKAEQKTQKDSKLSEAGKVLRSIAINHLKKSFGKISPYKRSYYKFWQMGNQIVTPYFYSDPRSVAFIVTLSKATLKNVQKENASVMGVNYFASGGNMFTVYFFKPEIILKHYIKANIELKKGTKERHISIRHEKKHIFFTRRGADKIVIPTDTNNYFIRFRMTDKEYDELQSVLPEAKKSVTPAKRTLKVLVKGRQGNDEFSITSAMVVALLSVLAKPNKPLTITEILTGMMDYGVLTRVANEKASVKHALAKIVKTGGVTSIKVKGKPTSYTLSDDIKIDVVI